MRSVHTNDYWYWSLHRTANTSNKLSEKKWTSEEKFQSFERHSPFSFKSDVSLREKCVEFKHFWAYLFRHDLKFDYQSIGTKNKWNVTWINKNSVDRVSSPLSLFCRSSHGNLNLNNMFLASFTRVKRVVNLTSKQKNYLHKMQSLTWNVRTSVMNYFLQFETVLNFEVLVSSLVVEILSKILRSTSENFIFNMMDW